MSLDVETHAHAHAHPTGRRWVDMVVAFSALMISVISLGVAIMHGHTMEEMAQANQKLVSANSWPFLSYGAGVVTVDGVPTADLHLVNAGVGPAKIESAELTWKGVAQRTDHDFLRACCNVDLMPGQYDSDVFLDYVMPAGQSVTFLRVKQSTDAAAFTALQIAMLSPNLKLVVCYCSIFDECWKADVTMADLNPKRVEKCDAAMVPFDQGLSRRPI